MPCAAGLVTKGLCIGSEWQSHGKMEGEVAVEIRMQQRVVSGTALDGRIDGFHAPVKAQDEIIQVQTDGAPCCRVASSMS